MCHPLLNRCSINKWEGKTPEQFKLLDTVWRGKALGWGRSGLDTWVCFLLAVWLWKSLLLHSYLKATCRLYLFWSGNKLKSIPDQPSTWPSLRLLSHHLLYAQTYLLEINLCMKCLSAREINLHFPRGGQISLQTNVIPVILRARGNTKGHRLKIQFLNSKCLSCSWYNGLQGYLVSGVKWIMDGDILIVIHQVWKE
jgi:hypothetical protein